MNDKLKAMIKQPSTWLGVAGLLVAGFGLENVSAEQISIVVASLCAIVYPPKTK